MAEDGLPVNSINDIAQTENGYLWLATFDGLVRFDGRNFKVYRSGQYEGLPSSRILKILVRPDGIWMHTESWHVVRFRDGAFATVAEEVDLLYEGTGGRLWAGTNDGILAYQNDTFRPMAPTEIRGDVKTVLTEEDGTLWAGTTDRGLYRRTPDGSVQQLTQEDGLGGQHVWTLAKGEKNRIWIGVTGGLHRWQDGEVVNVPVAGEEPASISVLHVEPDVGERCLVAAMEGIFRCERGRLVRTIQKPSSFSAPTFSDGLAQVGPDGAVWINAEAEVYRNGSPVFKTDRGAQSLFFDREGNAWIGTAGDGLFRLRPSPFTIYGESEGLASSNVYPIEQRQSGSVWLGTLGGGAARIGPTGEVGTYRPTKNGSVLKNVWALHEDRSGRLWMSGAAGRLCRFEKGRCARPDVESPIRARIRAIYEDRHGRLWAGSESQGLFRCDSGCLTSPDAWSQFTPENSDLPHAYVRTIHETPGGTLWFGTNGGGIARYEDGSFTPLTTAERLSSNLVRDIYQDTTEAKAPNVLWVVTEDQGLSRVRLSPPDSALSASVTAYRKQNGLYDNAIHQILKDGRGRFWISSNRGIFWVRKAELGAFARGEVDQIQSISYTTKEGLRSQEANGGVQPAGLKAQDGRLWFPTQKGAAVVDQATIPAEVESPQVHIETVMSGDSVVSREPEGVLRLTAAQRDFEIEYTGVRLSNPERVEFRYRLEGLRGDWRTAKNRRRAFFTNVPPGTYTFEVAARTRGGRWSQAPAELDVRVAPFFYETWWFYGICIALLGALGYGGVQYRLHTLRRREALLEEKIEERTQQLQERERELELENKRLDRFASVLSHDLRNPLNVAQGRLQLAREKVQEDPEGHLSSAGRALGRMDEIIEDTLLLTWSERQIDPEELEEVNLEEVGRKAWKNVEAPEATFEIGTSARLKCHAGRVQRLFENLFRNAVEHGGSGVTVTVGTLPGEGSPSGFYVEDDGPGIPEQQREKVLKSGYSSREEGTGLGLSIAGAIAEAHGWSLSVTGGRKGGARFEFYSVDFPGE
jgi:ligand-binding sensor domain-containing protein/signal transduction histidine kinase